MDGWKALVMVVAIVAVAGVAVYVFDEIKKAKIMQAKGEAVGNMVRTVPGMVSDFMPGRR
jgi:hypothetical protein